MSPSQDHHTGTVESFIVRDLEHHDTVKYEDFIQHFLPLSPLSEQVDSLLGDGELSRLKDSFIHQLYDSSLESERYVPFANLANRIIRTGTGNRSNRTFIRQDPTIVCGSKACCSPWYI